MNVKNAGIISLLASSFALGSSQFLPSFAYGVTSTNAITLNAGDIGRTLDPITWLVPAEPGKLPQDLSARTIVTVLDLQSSFVDLSFNISNTTKASFNAAIVSLGLGITQNVTSASLINKGNTFNSTQLLAANSTFPGGFKGIDIKGGDIKAGESDTFTLRIANNTDSFSNGVTIESYPIKFQSAYGSYEAAGVPEPITIVGSGLALGFGALFKKESTKKRSRDQVKA